MKWANPNSTTARLFILNSKLWITISIVSCQTQSLGALTASNYASFVSSGGGRNVVRRPLEKSSIRNNSLLSIDKRVNKELKTRLHVALKEEDEENYSQDGEQNNAERRYKRDWDSLETYDFTRARANCPPPIPSDLIFPEVNVRRESILFSPTIHTQEKNNALDMWNVVVMYCPYILTGVDSNSYNEQTSTSGQQQTVRASNFNKGSITSSNERHPMARIYNMLFVRVPTICAGLVYTKNLMEGNPLVVDIGFIGDGPVEISPILVFMVLASILR